MFGTSFTLNQECLDYLLCNYCCEPLSSQIYICENHPDIKICCACYAKETVCCYCLGSMRRTLSLEKMMGMISYQCEACSFIIKLTDMACHRNTCNRPVVFCCSFERFNSRCLWEGKSATDLFEHYKLAHSVIELVSGSSLIVLPHIELHTFLREIDKPTKSALSLPENCSLHNSFIVNLEGTQILIEFFYRIPSKSFIFIGRSEMPVNLSVLLCIPIMSLYGVANGLTDNQMETKTGRTTLFDKEIPLHMDKNNMIRSIAITELDVFEMFEKYSFLHGDTRYLQFGIRTNNY